MTNLRFARLSTTSITTAALFVGAAFAQDNCATATPISAVGAYAWDNTGFTDSLLTLGAPCLSTDGVVNGAPENDYWFEWTVPAAGDYQLNTIGTGFDTVLQVLLGPCGAESCVAADDDTGSPLPIGESQIDLPGQLGTEVYFVHVGQWSNNGQTTGAGILNVLDTPSNNTCASPDTTSFVGTGTFPWSNLGASSSDFDGGGLPCLTWGPGGAAPRLDVFFTWTAPAAGAYSFDTGGTGTDTILHIHDGVDCSATCIAFDDDGLGSFPVLPGESQAIVPGLAMGDSLLIQIGLWNGNAPTGLGFLTINPAVPPANDTCATPTAITTGTIPFDNTTATSSNFIGAFAGAPAVGSGDDPGADLFYVFNAPNNANYQIDTLGSTEDTVLNLYSGADCNATYLQNSQDEGTAQSRVFIVNGTSGQDYLIQAGGWQGVTTTAGLLNVTELPLPGPGNECSTAIAVGLGATAFDNTNMTTEGFSDGGGGACPTGFITGMAKQDMFFQFTAPANGDYRFDTLGSGQDTVMMLHQGVGCAATCLAYSDEALPNTAGESRAYAAGLLAGDNILVQVGTWAHTDVPAGVLNINAEAAPTNNDCATPVAINGEGTTMFNLEHPSITTSGFEGGDPINCPAGAPGPAVGDGVEIDVFFAWTADCDGDYQFSTDPTTGVIDTEMSIHSGSDCSATCLAANDDIDVAGGNFLSSVIISGVLAGETLLIQVGMANETLLSGPAQLTVVNLLGPCPVGGIVEVACSPASTHGGGGQATMTASTFGAGTPSGLQLQVTDGSPGEFGFFLVAGDHTNNIALFNGVLCMDTPFGRYNPNIANNQGFPQLNSIGQFDPSGVFLSLFGNAPSTGGSGYDVPTQLPFSPVGQVITPGDTWAFQCWFRDGASANFSDSIKVNF